MHFLKSPGLLRGSPAVKQDVSLVMRAETSRPELRKDGERASIVLDIFPSVCCENLFSHGNLKL